MSSIKVTNISYQVQNILRPSLSLAYLREKKKKDDQEKLQFARQVMEAANLIQARCYACIEEANAFAQCLGKSVTYSIYARGIDEEIQWERIRLNGVETAGVGGFGGAGRRIEKMAVVVTTSDSMGHIQNTRLISMDAFFREHTRLHTEVRRRKSLMPTGHMPVAAAGAGLTNGGAVDDTIHKAFISTKRPQTHSMSRSRSRVAIEPVKATDTPGKTFRKKVKKELKRDPSTPNTIGTGHSEPTMRLNRKETEEHLKRILENTVQVTKVLEDQLKELKARGWNANVI